MALLLANSLDAYTKKNTIVLVLVFISIVIYIVGWRLLKNYEPYYYFQPRYLAGFIIASYGLLLTTFKTKAIGKLQSILIVTSTTTASVVSWAAVSARYSLGPNYAWSNFWANESWLAVGYLPRSNLFLVLVIATVVLNYRIIRAYNSILNS